MKRIFILLFLSLSLVATQKSYAGWPIGKQRLILGSSVTIFSAKDYWDRQGNYFRNASPIFTSYSLGLSAQYGLSRRADLEVSVPIAVQRLYQSTEKNRGGLGDLQAGINYNIINYKFKNYTSVYGGVIAPLYAKYDDQTLGLGLFGINLKLMNTGVLSFASKKGYYNLEAGYRQFFGVNAPSQFTYLGALGVSLDKYNQVIADLSGVYSASDDKTFTIYTGAARDYSYLRTSLTYGHMFNRRFSAFASGFYTLAASNTGRGYGASLQVTARL